MASIGRGSRMKGAKFERKLADILSEKFGVVVKRSGAQEQWKHGKGDVEANPNEETIVHRFFWEAKKRESWAILKWYKKAVNDATPSGKIPVVVASKNQEDMYAFLKLSDFLDLLKENENTKKD